MIKDLGTQFRQYNDASGGGFGTGTYRCFLIENDRTSENFMIGFSIIATAKTVNDPTYGNTDGKSVLVIMVNDGDTDEMSVQINLNRYLVVGDDMKVRLRHNGAVTRKGASKQDLFEYISKYNSSLVVNGRVDLGALDCGIPLRMDNDDVQALISNLVDYAVYRNEYKKTISGRKK